MDHRGWPQGPGHGVNPDQNHTSNGRGGGFGPETSQQPAQIGPGAHGAASQPFPPYHQSSQHSLAGLAGISQPSPRPSPSSNREGLLGGPGYALPSIAPPSGQLDRERERGRDEQIHIKEEQDRRHREQGQRVEPGPPLGQPGGPVHLHQPVAVGPRSVHGPNGLLGNSMLSGPQPQLPLGAPGGPGNVFAGAPVPPSHAVQQMQPNLLMPFAPANMSQSAPTPSQPPMSQTPAQGQQPILNDALSYLDQVKVQFADHPDVYNRFLDIMKDFKSGAIDTPGVIKRVSELFTGNPELIQGFNTFLPPGYRIECGAGDDPNTIRVTTPMGTSIQSIPARPSSRSQSMDNTRPLNGTFTPQPGSHVHNKFSPSGPAGAPLPGQQNSQHFLGHDMIRQQEQQAMHQQEQRGVNSLQNAVSAATADSATRPGASPRLTNANMQDNSAAMTDASGPAGAEKRGPVEFNHAISYVNKIKNRFASQPDIYKQFLEILQTYQRESKPIQDVYGQVTSLFKTAPDLLEDFKQFLPESAAHAKAAERARQQAEENAMLSNVRNETNVGLYGSPVVSKESQMATPGHGRGLPPVGNFAPTPISKENKRKRTDRQGPTGALDGPAGTAGAKGSLVAPPGKRVKQQHAIMKDGPTQPPPSPSLIPALPVPLLPTTTMAATSDEVAFFDRVKKAVGNKNAMNEFLKLCNLFSQDLLDRSTLIHRVKAFIGHHAELMKWFQDFVGYEERDVIHENQARIPTGRISLSNCRGLGPSYRLLPKRERQKLCSGRDELCNQVLNDEWASHPTWASEDSGFIAHRKNVHEEGLHRIEEERHDYDFNIETCGRTIQLLEPIATQLLRMTVEEEHAYRLPPGLGGQSETIYKRVIMKIYGREKGQEVVESLQRHPYQVIPVLLNRLKERLETWKMAQREWEKVWRDQTQKMFWKSLDHQAVNTSRNDKRQFQTKTLQNEIQVKHEEMRRSEYTAPGTMKKPQIEFHAHDLEVLVDVAYLLLVHVDTSMSTDHPRLAPFIKEFVPLFFGLDEQAFNAQLRIRAGDRSETIEDINSTIEDHENLRVKKNTGKGGNLLRQAVDRGRNGRAARKDRDESNASGSRASSPGAASAVEDEMAVEKTEVEEAAVDSTSQRWFEHPNDGNRLDVRDIDPNESKRRDVFRLWANTPIYCFLRTFTILCERLCRIKESETVARAVIEHALVPKPALELGIIDKLPSDFFADTSKDANYYTQVLGKLEEFLRGDLEFSDVEDCLRRYYLMTAYPLYAFEKMITAIARFATQILNGDSKEKTWDLWQLFRKDRVRESTSVPQQTDYRKSAEKMLKEGDLYKIDYDVAKQDMRFYLTKKDDPTLLDDGLSPMDQENRWRSYIASYQTVDDTDAVDHSMMSRPLLFRNMRALGADPDSSSYPPSPRAGSDSADGGGGNVGERLINRFMAAKNEENLVLRISVGDYKTHFEPKSQEGWILPMAERQGGRSGVEERDENRHHREEAMRDHFVMNHGGMKGLAKDEVERKNEDWNRLTSTSEPSAAAEADQMEVE